MCILSYIKSWKKEKRLMKNRDLLLNYDNAGYHRELLDPSKFVLTIFKKDFKEGDEICWLGHDNVFGLLHGQFFIADDEAVKKQYDLSFWQKVDELDFE